MQKNFYLMALILTFANTMLSPFSFGQTEGYQDFFRSMVDKFDFEHYALEKYLASEEFQNDPAEISIDKTEQLFHFWDKYDYDDSNLPSEIRYDFPESQNIFRNQIVRKITGNPLANAYLRKTLQSGLTGKNLFQKILVLSVLSQFDFKSPEDLAFLKSLQPTLLAIISVKVETPNRWSTFEEQELWPLALETLLKIQDPQVSKSILTLQKLITQEKIWVVENSKMDLLRLFLRHAAAQSEIDQGLLNLAIRYISVTREELQYAAQLVHGPEDRLLKLILEAAASCDSTFKDQAHTE